jgi:hypothetical protein
MSKKQLRQYARAKLREVNEIIDRKILAGEDYSLEAKIHAGLVKTLNA